MRFTWILFILLCIPVALHSEENDVCGRSKPVRSIWMVETGYGSLLDTYLSPLRFDGMRLSVGGQWMKALGSDKVRMEFDSRLSSFITKSPARNVSMYSLSLEFGWGLLKGWSLPWDIAASAGLGPDLHAGVIYLPGGGNNPASAKFSLSLALKGSVSRPMRIGRMPVLLSDQVTLPSAGVFFSPAFGESYYEIWLGNHSGLAHFGWWGNNFAISNLLSLDLQLGRHGLRVGYGFAVRSSWINHLNTQMVSHSIVIGFLPSGIMRGSRVRGNDINPFY